MDKKYNFLENVGWITSLSMLSVILIPAYVTLRGWVLAITWAWFLVDLGLPPISVPRAIGISTIFGLLSERIESKKSKKQQADPLENFAYLLGQMFLSPLIILAIAYVVHLFL